MLASSAPQGSERIVGIRNTEHHSNRRLFGRKTEQALLQGCFEKLLARQGQLVLIGGEAGSGKTSLVDELEVRARGQQTLVLRGHCYELEATPAYAPWREIGQRYTECASESEPPVPALLTDVLASTVPASPPVLLKSVVDFFATIARSRAAMLILEDLHWSDPASLDLLRLVARSLRFAPLLLLANLSRR